MPKLCGLELQELGKFKGSLEAILHAIDEQDWERIAPDEIQTDLRPYIEKMEKAGCTSIPHGLFTATEIFRYLITAIKKKDELTSIRHIATLGFALLSDVHNLLRERKHLT